MATIIDLADGAAEITRETSGVQFETDWNSGRLTITTGRLTAVTQFASALAWLMNQDDPRPELIHETLVRITGSIRMDGNISTEFRNVTLSELD